VGLVGGGDKTLRTDKIT